MIVIREEQIQALAKLAVANFEKRAFAHLVKCWPRQCKAKSEPVVRESIRRGIERARGYGITTQRGVVRYLDVMYALGEDFDTDPRLPWAGQVLRDATIPPWEKVKRIWKRTKQVLHERERSGRPTS